MTRQQTVRTPALMPLPQSEINAIVSCALHEDAPRGDLTANLLIGAETRADALVVAREAGTASGLSVFAATMHLVDPSIKVDLLMSDGELFRAGDTLAVVTGPARGILTAERVALNLLQRMSGIATVTDTYVQAVAEFPVRIADTRKTTPGLRIFERYAVRCGGGFNHRDNLSEAVMAKDNHLSLLGEGPDLTAALIEARARLGHTVHFEVEVDRLDQIPPVLDAGVDTIMLDNFSLSDLAEGVRIVAGRAIVEASGGVTLGSVRSIAETGVDVISSGALTHSARSLDIGLDFTVARGS